MNTPTRQKLAAELIAAGACSAKGRRRIYRAVEKGESGQIAEIIAFEAKSEARAKARFLNRIHETWPEPYRRGEALWWYRHV